MYIYITLFAIEALMVLTGFLIGLKRGAGKAIIRLIELILVSVISFFIGKTAISSISDLAFENTGLDESIMGIIEAAPLAQELVIGLIGALVMPIIFMLAFIILKPISLIGLSALTKLIAPRFGEKTPPTLKSRLLGGLAGALTSLVVAIVVLSPFYTGVKVIATLPDEAFSSITEAANLAEEDLEVFNAIVPQEDMTPPLSALVVNAATTFTGDKKSYNASLETPRIADLAFDVINAYNESKEKGDDDLICVSAAIAASVAHLEDSEYIAGLTTSLLNSIGENIKNGNDIFGLAEGMDGPMADMLLKSIGNIFTGVTPENIAANIAAIAGDGEKAGVLTVITEITSAGDISEVLKDSEKVDKLADSLITIAENPALSSTMDSLTEMGAGMLNEALPEIDTEEREEYMETLSDSVNELLTATKETQGDFAASVDTATSIIMEKVSETDTEITEGEAKLIAICALHNFGTAENYADAENAPISIEDIENFFKLNK